MLGLREIVCMVVLVALGGTGAVARAQGLDAELDQAVQLLEELEWEAAVVELNRLLEGGQLNKDQAARALSAGSTIKFQFRALN